MLLIAGGLPDPNLQTLANAADAMGLAWLDGRVSPGVSPPFHWDLSAAVDTPPWGDPVRPKGAFVRQDVFSALEDRRAEVAQRALGWFTAFQGWLMAHPEIRVFNAEIAHQAFNKPAALLCARRAGLRIADTWVSNDVVQMRERSTAPTIAKPVAGGGLCHTLEDALKGVSADYSAMPALIQPRLVAPELRVFVVGQQAYAFEVSSPSLDYRAAQDAEVTPVAIPDEATALLSLMCDFRMDFGAADFKTDAHTGELIFLELNTSPMFARFDLACDGVLAAAMVRHLIS